MNRFALITVCLTLTVFAYASEPEQIFRTEGAVVYYTGINPEYAEAIAKTTATARAVAAQDWAFNMPQTVIVKVNLAPGRPARLFNDGHDRLFLTVGSPDSLLQPSKSGYFHIYGLCHEVAHLAMYRMIRDHSWMTTAAAEGWAHYLGSRIVDEVHKRQGPDLWPDPYDYLADGTKRLNQQLLDSTTPPSPVTQGALLWWELVDIVGDKNLAGIFKAWGQAEVDPTDPGAALRKTLLAANSDERLSAWWNRAEPIFVFRRPASGFAARTAKPSHLIGPPVELSFDDGKPSGKRSTAGGGHAVLYKVEGADWYLTGVKILGSRYGYPQAPQENFHVWLCDKDSKVIADFTFPYAKFTRGAPRWVTLPIEPTNVPAEFMICVGFNPTATKGVFVHYDGEASGNSFTGLPGRMGGQFSGGDWMIRAAVDQLKISNPLTPSK